MKTKKLIAEIICLLLALELFYEGVWKLFTFNSYQLWLQHVPYLNRLPVVLGVFIPVAELTLAVLLSFSKHKVRALLFCMGAVVLYVGWVMCAHLFTQEFFWPYEALWREPTWMQKMSMALVMAWLAIVGAWLFANVQKKVIQTAP